MTAETRRDPRADHLITPDNAALSLACELQRDWARLETVPQVIQIVLTERLLQE
jgi:hypothetical protein